MTGRRVLITNYYFNRIDRHFYLAWIRGTRSTTAEIALARVTGVRQY